MHAANPQIMVGLMVRTQLLTILTMCTYIKSQLGLYIMYILYAFKLSHAVIFKCMLNLGLVKKGFEDLPLLLLLLWQIYISFTARSLRGAFRLLGFGLFQCILE